MGVKSSSNYAGVARPRSTSASFTVCALNKASSFSVSLEERTHPSIHPFLKPVLCEAHTHSLNPPYAKRTPTLQPFCLSGRLKPLAL